MAVWSRDRSGWDEAAFLSAVDELDDDEADAARRLYGWGSRAFTLRWGTSAEQVFSLHAQVEGKERKLLALWHLEQSSRKIELIREEWKAVGSGAWGQLTERLMGIGRLGRELETPKPKIRLRELGSEERFSAFTRAVEEVLGGAGNRTSRAR